EENNFWLYFFGIIIMFIVIFFAVQYYTENTFGRRRTTSGVITTTPMPTTKKLNFIQIKQSNVPTAKGAVASTSLPNSNVQSNTNALDLSKDYYAEINTNKGLIKIDLFEKNAPNTVANFINLANSKYYDGTKFFKLISGVLLQGGSDK